MVNKWLIGTGASVMALGMMGSAAFAATAPTITNNSAAGYVTINENGATYYATHGSHADLLPGNTDPSSTLTAQQEGTLTISYVNSGPNQGDYQAVWTWSGIEANQSVLLIGDAGTTINNSVPETYIVGTASPEGGSATIFIPANQYHATSTSPETFEMLALFGSLPTGQMPEVPFAAGLPLAALGIGLGALWYRRLHA